MKDKTEEMSELYTMDHLNAEYSLIWKAQREAGVLWKDIPSFTEWVLGRLQRAESIVSSLPPAGPQDHVVTGIAGGLAMLQEALNQGDIASAQSLTRSMIYRIDSLPPSGAASETTNLHWLKDHISQAVHDYGITGKRDISAHLEQAFVSLQKAIAVEEGR